MAAVLHTTTQQIRAVLGITDREIEDVQMTDLDLETLIEIEVDRVYPTHAAAVAAGDAGGATDAEKKLSKTVKLFCAYQGAVFLLPGLQNLIVQKVTDGDAEMQRFMKDDLDKTKEQITGMRDYLRATLNPTEYGTSASIIVPIVAALPDYDPVTNEGSTI